MSSIMDSTPKKSPEVVEAEAKDARLEELHVKFNKSKDNIGDPHEGHTGLEGFHRCYNRVCDDYRKDLPIGTDCQCKKSRTRAPGSGSSQLF